MYGVVNPITYLISLLVYTGHDGGREYIFEREGLCMNAGCKCTEWGLVCNNFEYAYFDLTIHDWYRSLCLDSCGCTEILPPTRSATDLATATGLFNSSTMHAASTTGRSMPNGLTLPSSDCLAGENGGWTTKQLAKCCPGYTFQALTPKEAYDLYGSILNATAVLDNGMIIGICSNVSSTLDLSNS